MTIAVKLTDVVRPDEFPARIFNVMRNQFGYDAEFTYEQVLSVPLEQWSLLPNLGKKSLAELDRLIEEKTGQRLPRKARPAWRRPHKTLRDAATDLRAAITFTLSPKFPAPNDDSARIAWLRAWWEGEKMRGAVEEKPPSNDLADYGWAPGFYAFRCACTPADAKPLDWPDGAKRSTRCKACAAKAREEAHAAWFEKNDPTKEKAANRLIRAQVSGEEPPPAKEDSQ